LVGPLWAGLDVSELEALPNVHLLGFRNIADLPGYLKAMDVTIIPYQVNDITRYTFPMKTAEYLAAGKPVVVPDMPALRIYEKVLDFAASHDEFVSQIEYRLHHNTDADVARRQSTAQQNCWDNRVRIQSDLLAQGLEAKLRAA